MSIKKLSAEELLGLNKFEVDEENAHIQLDQEACARCGEKPCLYFLLKTKLFFHFCVTFFLLSFITLCIFAITSLR